MAKDSPVPVESTELDVFEDREAALAALIRGEALELADPQMAQEMIARRILYAQTEEEAFRDMTTVSTKDAVGREFEIRDMRVFRSQFNDGAGGFVACEAVDLESGEVVILNSSSAKIGAKLIWLKMNDALPRKVRIRAAAKPTAGGFVPLDLETV